MTRWRALLAWTSSFVCSVCGIWPICCLARSRNNLCFRLSDTTTSGWTSLSSPRSGNIGFRRKHWIPLKPVRSHVRLFSFFSFIHLFGFYPSPCRIDTFWRVAFRDGGPFGNRIKASSRRTVKSESPEETYVFTWINYFSTDHRTPPLFAFLFSFELFFLKKRKKRKRNEPKCLWVYN